MLGIKKGGNEEGSRLLENLKSMKVHSDVI